MTTAYNLIEHMKLTALEVELYLREIKPYNKDREIDNEGNELRFNKKLGCYEAVNFKPFWSVTQ